jgi:hypothetical protein
MFRKLILLPSSGVSMSLTSLVEWMEIMSVPGLPDQVSDFYRMTETEPSFETLCFNQKENGKMEKSKPLREFNFGPTIS